MILSHDAHYPGYMYMHSHTRSFYRVVARTWSTYGSQTAATGDSVSLYSLNESPAAATPARPGFADLPTLQNKAAPRVEPSTYIFTSSSE